MSRRTSQDKMRQMHNSLPDVVKLVKKNNKVNE